MDVGGAMAMGGVEGLPDPALDRFLANVDEVTDVIQAMASKPKIDSATNTDCDGTADSQPSSEHEAVMKRAELLLKKQDGANGESEGAGLRVGVNRTVINPASSGDKSGAANTHAEEQPTSQEAWMDAIASDAERRAAARRMRIAEGAVLREAGNAAFQAQDWHKALDLYSQGLAVSKDTTPLWTNRAQVHMRLGRWEEAINDSEWALRVDPACLKAHLTRAKAFSHLWRFQQAREGLDEALSACVGERGAESAVGRCHQLVAQIETGHALENHAQQLRDTNSPQFTTISGVIKAISTPNHPPMYYTGAVACLATLITSDTDRATFRLEGGFKPTLALTDPLLEISQNEKNKGLVHCVLGLIAQLTTGEGGHDNVGHLLENHPQFIRDLLQMSSENVDGEVLKVACDLLRALLAAQLQRAHVVTILGGWDSVCQTISNWKTLDSTRIDLLDTLAQIPPFCAHLTKESGLGVIHTIAQSLSRPNCEPNLTIRLLSICDTIFTNSHAALVGNTGIWEALLSLVASFSESGGLSESWGIFDFGLGLLANCTVAASAEMRCLFGDRLWREGSRWLVSATTNGGNPDLIERSARILSLLASSTSAAEFFHDNPAQVASAVKTISKYPDNETLCSHFAKLLALATKSDAGSFAAGVSGLYATTDKRLKVLINVVEMSGFLPDGGGAFAGNAALLLANLCHDANVCRTLALDGEKLVRRLLAVAANSRSDPVRGNTGIALSRLVAADKSLMAVLRELDGIKILHDCVKFVV